MELWIRNQDKTVLGMCNRLTIEGNSNKTFSIYGFNYHLGTYKTKERALEVLDEIQETLMMCIKSNGNEHLVGTSCYVYEMPQE